MLYKNLPPKIWRKTFVIRASLDSLAMARAMLTGSFKELSAIFRAYVDAHKISKTYSNQRPDTIRDDAIPPYRGSIVLDYFLRRKKSFQQLPKDRFNTN